MKRYLVLIAILASVVIVLLCWRDRNEVAPKRSDTDTQASAVAEQERDAAQAARNEPLVTNAVAPYQKLLLERPEVASAVKENPDVPVTFYGRVVDQDTNGLLNVKVDVEITQWNVETPADSALKIAHLARQTDADGRFEVSGINGHTVTIKNFTKNGFEPEQWRREFGVYNAQAGSFDQPMVFHLWQTNLHEPLISGEKKFEVAPDGRRYGIDLVNGTVSEGKEGDLVMWIKRAESVSRKFDWSCELAVPTGGLVEDTQYLMFRAPEVGYTNAFVHEAKVGTYGWGVATGDKRFYVKLRNGQMYGRIVVNLRADHPATMRLSYAVNPSGSRLLR